MTRATDVEVTAHLALRSDGVVADGDRAAAVLTAIGFRVIRQSLRLVRFGGPPELFERTFAGHLALVDGWWRWRRAPSLPPALAEVGSHVALPVPVEFG